MGLFGAAIGTGFVAGPALGGLFSGLGDGPLHQAPFLLAAGFGIIALVLSMRLRESATKAPAEKAPPAPLGVRIITVLRSELALYALAFLLFEPVFRASRGKLYLCCFVTILALAQLRLAGYLPISAFVLFWCRPD